MGVNHDTNQKVKEGLFALLATQWVNIYTTTKIITFLKLCAFISLLIANSLIMWLLMSKLGQVSRFCIKRQT